MVKNCGNCARFTFAKVSDPDLNKMFLSDEMGHCGYDLPLCFQKRLVSKHLVGCRFFVEKEKKTNG
jgi:hypothetical protein